MIPNVLSGREIERFHADGFLTLPGYLQGNEIATLRDRAESIVARFDMEQISIFSTEDQKRTSDEYFLTSGGEVRCFFEEKSFDADGNLTADKMHAINKIGHALHDLDPDFEKASYKRELSDIARAIGLRKPMMAQSQYIFKQPGIGGKVVAHQDSTYIYTDPPSCIGFWIALEDATLDNGCLWAIPGSHARLEPSRRFVRTGGPGAVEFVGDKENWDLARMVPLEVTSGTLVLLHGSLVHMSQENRSPSSRHAYILHLVDGELPWPADNWLQRSPDRPFRYLDEVLSQSA